MAFQETLFEYRDKFNERVLNSLVVKLNPYSRLNVMGLALEIRANAFLIATNKMMESVVVMCAGIS